MVRSILEGRKTQTRRVVFNWRTTNYQSIEERDDETMWPWRETEDAQDYWYTCPYGQPGDRLWVRETWMDLLGTGNERVTEDRGRCAYRADTPAGSYGDEARKDYGLKWRPSIHMPRWASRILLEVTGVRVERLKDISDAGPANDCTAEGVFHCGMEVPTYEQWHGNGFHSSEKWMYRKLWESINGPGSWEANPWVWVIEFWYPEVLAENK